ncbi:MAG: GNAT family N-acetyltransferase [Dehalobacter sp. 4CP]|uniref:GNAT family N-acetyltransferase n=1 Tax=Dehalobacter sp. CP TaxID=2594474 RepID=UPI0013CA83BA|nr:GNAT family N-acetyltransferase [Dehalobacter sp.]NBJ16914.1 GNAT family N-acetyltransferase [Dehalobacter sp. 4CP]
MIRITENQIEPVAKLLTECFIDDPLTVLQIKGIIYQEEFLTKLFQIQLGVFVKTRDVYSLDDKSNSVIIGYEKKKLKMLKQIILSIQATQKIRKQVSKEDFELYANNVRSVSKAINLNWHKQFIKKNYYHINVVAVAHEERGKGKLRALITPIVENCQEKGIPIILETDNSNHIPMYEHMGFQLIKTMEDSRIGLNQYCFIKYSNT